MSGASQAQAGRPGHPVWGRSRQLHGRCSPAHAEFLERLAEKTGQTLTELHLTATLLYGALVGVELPAPTTERDRALHETALSLVAKPPQNTAPAPEDPHDTKACTTSPSATPPAEPTPASPTAQEPTETEANELWERLSFGIKAIVKDENYSWWIAPLVPKRLGPEGLVLEAPHPYLKEQLEERFVGVFHQVAKELLGTELAVRFDVAPREALSPSSAPAQTPEAAPTGFENEAPKTLTERERANERARVAHWEETHSMPKLQGTPKQLAWARLIRYLQLNVRLPHQVNPHTIPKLVSSRLKNQREASWWIDRRTKTVPELLAECSHELSLLTKNKGRLSAKDPG